MMNTKILFILLFILQSAVYLLARGPDLSVPPADLRGVVIWADSQAPIDGMRVRVWDASTERVIYRTVTDNDGVFRIPEMGEGDHFITIGSLRVDMRILEPRSGVVTMSHGMVIALPRRLPLGAPMVSGGSLLLLPQEPDVRLARDITPPTPVPGVPPETPILPIPPDPPIVSP